MTIYETASDIDLPPAVLILPEVGSSAPVLNTGGELTSRSEHCRRICRRIIQPYYCLNKAGLSRLSPFTVMSFRFCNGATVAVPKPRPLFFTTIWTNRQYYCLKEKWWGLDRPWRLLPRCRVGAETIHVLSLLRPDSSAWGLHLILLLLIMQCQRVLPPLSPT